MVMGTTTTLPFITVPIIRNVKFWYDYLLYHDLKAALKVIGSNMGIVLEVLS